MLFGPSNTDGKAGFAFIAVAGNLKACFDLCKIRISAVTAFSSATAFLLASGEIGIRMAIVTLAVFLLACGSSALNQYMERSVDSLMDRTMGRPIPSGRIKPPHAFLCSLLLPASGAFLLLFAGGLVVCALGLFAILWYNGLYPRLKRRTTFAIIIGALTGAVPPVIGWLSGGGAATSPMLYSICLFLFIWQVPHSLVFIMHYGREYEKAGLPSLTVQLSKPQLLRIIFIR